MSSRQNVKWTKCQVDKMSSRQNDVAPYFVNREGERKWLAHPPCSLASAPAAFKHLLKNKN